MRAAEIMSGFRELLAARGVQTGFDIHFPHMVELPGWTRDAMGAEECDNRLIAARGWAKRNSRGLFTSHIVTKGQRPTGRRFEFEHETDAAMFKLYWAGI